MLLKKGTYIRGFIATPKAEVVPHFAVSHVSQLASNSSFAVT